MAGDRDHILFADSVDRLKDRTLTGVALSLLARWVRVGSQIVTFVILARLLTPLDFGLVGMMTPFIAMASIIGDLGMSSATVQSRSITPGQASALLYLSLAAGAALAFLFSAAAPLFVLLYQEPRVMLIGIALSAVFPLIGLAGQHQALLQRSLDFPSLLKADLAGSIGATVLAVAAALAGAGYWAIVIRFVSQPAIYTAGLWLATRWRPGRADWPAGTGRMMRFGGYVLGFNAVNTTARHLDNVLIGWRWGEAALGPYALAYRLFFMPVQQLTQPVGSVMVSSLSKLRDAPERYRRAYLDAVRPIAYLGMAPPMAIAVASTDAIVFLAGPQWLAAGEILRWLAPVGAVHVASASLGWLNLSMGRADRYFQWGLIGTPVYLSGFVLGLPWGAEGVAIGYLAANTLLLVPGVMWACRDNPVRPTDILVACAPAVLVCIAAVAVAVAVQVWMTSAAPVARLICTGALVCLLLLTCARRALGPELIRTITTWVKSRLPDRFTSRAS